VRESVIGIVCARSGSKRLLGKNMMEIRDMSLSEKAYHTLEGCCDKVVLVTDIKELLESDLVTLYRPPFISHDHVPLQSTVKWALFKISGRYGVVVVLMPNCPMITKNHVEKCINLLVDNNLNVVRSYGKDGKENGVIVIRIEYFFKHWIDTHAGAIVTTGIEIHTQEDFDKVKKLMEGK